MEVPPAVIHAEDAEIEQFERELIAVRNGLLRSVSKAETLIAEIRSARAKLAARG